MSKQASLVNCMCDQTWSSVTQIVCRVRSRLEKAGLGEKPAIEYDISYTVLNEIMQNLTRWSIIDGYEHETRMQLGRMSVVVVPRRTSQ